MKTSRNLYTDLILRYLVFLLAAVIATGLFLGALAFLSLDTISRYPESAGNLAVYYRDIEYDNEAKRLNLPSPIEEGAWVEILKENRVVYSEGDRAVEKTAYTQDELALIANNVDALSASETYLYEYIPFDGMDGNPYTFLYIRQKEGNPAFKAEFGVPDSLEGSEFAKELRARALWSTGLFLSVMALLILLFSRVTTKKMIRPIESVNEGFEHVMKGDYSVRLSYSGNREFEELRDAFNIMIKRLQNAERENKAIAESKKRLLLDISHDLRTPATTIQGYAKVLLDGVEESPENRRRYLGYLHEKSKALSGLIERLFLYTKLDSSVYELNREVRDLSEFLRHIFIGYYGEIERKGFLTDIDIPERKILFNFDSVELERALSNLIGNILKYNPAGTNLSVALTEEKGAIRIGIGDDGVGIPDNIKDRLFNAFVRGDEVRRIYDGTGLGLAITKKIIELHGGTIRVESEKGNGSFFVIDFPKGE
jgi:signal transduction histidine kinase